MWFFGKKKKEKKEEKVNAQQEQEVKCPKCQAKAEATEQSDVKVEEVKEVKKEETTPIKKESTPAKAKKETAKTAKTEQKPKTVAKKEETAEEVAEEKAGTQRKSMYRVMYDKDDRTWKIKKDGAKRIIASYTTKEEAMKRVKALCEKNDMSVVVHKKDGKFQKKN